MTKSKKKPTRRSGKRKRSTGVRGREWVGGRLSAPVYVDGPEPFRPEMVLWLELPENLVLGHELIDPNGPALPFGDTLLRTMAAPMVGPPRKPRRIRVANAHLAAQLGAAVPDIEVVVAPTPELDAFVAQMLASLPGGNGSGPSYFEDGRVATDTVAALFQAADALFRVAPWKLARDSQVLRLDIPALGVEGACVSIIGALRENLGLVIFPSHLAMERFLAGVDTDRPRDAPLDMGTTTLSLSFERGADLPPQMRREAVERGWPVAGPSAYPWVQHRDRDGAMRPLDEQDVRVVAACAGGVADFFSKQRKRFEHASTEPVSECFVDPNEIEVRLTMPYEAGNSRPTADQPPSKPAVTATEGITTSPAALHELDGRLVEGMIEFAGQRFGDAWSRAARGITERNEAIGLLAPFLVYQVLVKGKPVARWFAQANARRLSDTERSWLQAQQTAWLSVWEVLSVEPGRSLELRDLLTGEVRDVQEVSASKSLVARHAVLARVADYKGMSLLCGCHARPLPPREAADVVRQARSRLRRKGTVPTARLRDEKTSRYLITRWEDAVEELDGRPVTLPKLQNTDEEDLLITVDRFAFDPSRRSEIEAALATIDGVLPPESGEADGSYAFNRPGNPTPGSRQDILLARAWIDDGKLRVESNSVERADRIREQIETACGERIRHRSREHTDPIALMGKRDLAGDPGEGPPQPASGPSSDKANALILDFKRQHYSDWPDQSLPALGGETPRAAVRTKDGKEQVKLLLKEFEAGEARLPEGQRLDFDDLRRELGLRD